jgi:hypothetical protein
VANSSDLTSKEAIDQASQALFRGIGEVAKAHPAIAANEPAKAFIAVLFPILGLSVSRMAQRFFADRIPKLSEGYAGPFGSEEAAAAHAQEHEEDADYHEVMFRTFRAMTDAVDPEVVPALGYLAGQYNFAGRRPDAHFRAMGRLLCELEPGELQQLRGIFRSLLDKTSPGSAQLDLICGPDDTVSIPAPGTNNTPLGIFPSGLRLFRLLKTEAMAESMPTELYWGANAGPGEARGMRIRAATLESILATIDPRPW